MIYRDLIGKKIGLIGEEKIVLDIQEFFCELSYESVIVASTIDEEMIVKLTGCDIVIVTLIDNRIIEEIRNRLEITILNLDDLYRMVDELETFYIDKLFYKNTICVYGTKDNISKLFKQNPNIKIDCFVCDKEEDHNANVATVSLCEIHKLNSPFVIIADPVSTDLKKIFEKNKLEFGKEFHFFNGRIPKHPTSYYLDKTLKDSPKYTIPCDYTKKALSIKAHGNIMACCSSVGLSMGNYLYTSIEAVLNGIQAQLIKLSINNRTFSFCSDLCFMFREEKYCLNDEYKIKTNPRENISLKRIKDFNVQLGYDRSCNLACPSCRDHRIIKPEDDDEVVEMMHEEVQRMCLKKPRNIRIGNGELFFSPYYRDIIFNCYESDEIALISNGMLFTPENWSYLEKRYKDISLEVSIDAINSETYKKLRGGNLEKLRNNMKFAGELRRQGKLKKFSISFVIQVENFREMIGFVEYGKRINADLVHFMKLNNFGHIPKDEFIKMDVYDKRNENHEEFVSILQNPLFSEEMVHVDNIGNYLHSN